MRRYALLLAALLGNPVLAQPSAPTVPGDGLGVGGFATRGPWFISGQVHVFLWTGSNPENYGTFVLDLPLALLGHQQDAAGQQVPGTGIARPVCVMSAARTGGDYAGSYANPEWPPVFLWQEAYDLQHQTATFGWAVWGQALQPQAAYSVNVVCPPKVPGFTGMQ